MAFETEAVLDRRWMRRRLSFWRGLAIIVGFLALGVILFASAERAGWLESRQIARVTLEGIITEDRAQLRLLRKIGESKKVAAVIVLIWMPGRRPTRMPSITE